MLYILLMLGSISHAGVLEEIADLQQYRHLREAENPPTLAASVYEKVLKGPQSGIRIVPDVKAAQGWGLMIFDVSVQAAWTAVTSEHEHAGRTAVSHSQLISGSLYVDDRYVFQYMPIPILTDRWWIVHLRHNKTLYEQSGGRMWELYWDDDSRPERLVGSGMEKIAAGGMPIEWTKGAWLFMPLANGKTLVEYFIWSHPGGKLPPGPASRFAAGAVKTNLRNMEKFAKEKAGTDLTGVLGPDGSQL